MASYEGALEAAGAKVLVFRQFGSYQGGWWSKVAYQGAEHWVHGTYGSCSGCDALQAEFDYSNEPEETYEEWKKSWRRDPDASNTEEDYESAMRVFREKYARFGSGYLDDLLGQAEAEKAAAENIEWDSDAAEMLAFVRANAIGEGVSNV